jgi:hypothetical protein
LFPLLIVNSHNFFKYVSFGKYTFINNAHCGLQYFMVFH